MGGCIPFAAMVRMMVARGLSGMRGMPAMMARSRCGMQRPCHDRYPAGEERSDKGQEKEQPFHGNGCRMAIGT
ncbi:hypothetical protein C7449_10131 [Mycoplana dimorpha]|uniref:Uncharacterized protein n=1 Tax=Mycoplana dimorpha TaxID=28320 RepID=A0A2T5BHF6_MYCDI|nr:hypothetical protein C7449_10131 [Mycoplana dimorpha]